MDNLAALNLEQVMDMEDAGDSKGWSEETSRVFLDYGRYFVPE